MNSTNLVLLVFLLYWLLVMFLDRRGTLGKYNITAYGPILMLRTTKGQGFLDKLAVHKRFWRIFASIGLPAMLIGMLAMLLITLLPIIISVKTQTLPEPSKFTELQNILLIPGVNEFFPLVWGIIALIVTLVVHEFSHAILCKVEGIKVKSMGILLVLIPIGGFAEPDEEQLLGKKEDKSEKEVTTEIAEPKRLATRSERVRVLTAGVMANFVTALIAFILFFSVLGSLTPVGEVMVSNVVPGSPADLAGVRPNMILTKINDKQINNANDFLLYLKNMEPRSNVTLNLFDRGLSKKINLIAAASNETRSGVKVFKVMGNSPAEATGIRPDMVLVKINNTEIKAIEDFIDFMNSTRHGQKVDVYLMSNSSVNASMEVFRNVILAKYPEKDVEKGYIGISYSGEDISYLVGMGVGQFPAENFLHGLKSIPSSLTHITGWGSLFILPFFDIEGVTYPRFQIDLLTYFYEPTGWATSIGTGIFWILNLFLWIGWTNFIAGLFNCLPAVPLDGGHVFRDVMTSSLSKIIGDGEKVEKLSNDIVVLFAFLILMLLVFMIIGPHIAQWF